MRIADNQCDETVLARLSAEVCELISKGGYRELADRFGYALAFDKDPAEAIQVDVDSSLLEGGAFTRLASPSEPEIKVRRFKPNDANFVALVECRLELMDGTGGLFVELVVTAVGDEKHVTLEQISHTV